MGLLTGGAAARPPAKQGWWLAPQRMLQTNLREIDANMDLDRYVADVKNFGASVVLFNVGGIVANYPTKLPFHYRNPNLTGDLVGEVVRRLHKEGIRTIGRFDFSKINEKLARQKPEWLYVSEAGRHVNYNGQVHTCLNGGYQQEYMLKILTEALERYPLDGVFFNMIGYRRRDYSGNYHGLCQCDNCRKRFKAYCGLDLPAKAKGNDPAYRKYRQFCHQTAAEQFHKVNAHLKARWPAVAICTYTTAGVDVVRKESNSRLGRGRYHDSRKAAAAMPALGDRQLANAAVHFIAIAYRHAAVAPHLTLRRIWQHMTAGAWLDFYCIGPLHRQEDRTGLDLVGELFRFHAANERSLVPAQSAADVGLLRRPGGEYDGLYQILTEGHVAFELLASVEALRPQHRVLVVPQADGLDAEACRRLDDFVQRGGKLLLTGRIPDGLKCFGGTKLLKTHPRQPGAYVRIRPEDRKRLSRPVLAKLDLVFLERPLHVYRPAADTEGLLRLIPEDMFGPPEKCYYRRVSEHPGLLHRRSGRGAAACLPWEIGSMYAQQGHVGHAALVLGALDGVLAAERRLRVEAPPLVEMSHRRGDGFEWVALFNHGGRVGNALHAPIPIRDIRITLKPHGPVGEVRLLKAAKILRPTRDDSGRLTVTIPRLERYEVVLFAGAGGSS